MEMPNEITIPEPKRVYLSSLRIDNTNPNVMSTANFEALKLNIKKFGFIIPIITNEDYVIADGYHRWKAARELGMSEVLVIKLPLKEVDRRMLRQVLNKLRGQHEEDKDIIEYEFFDESGVLDEMEQLLPDFSVDISSLNKEVEEDDFVPDLEKEPTYEVKKGEVWKLGEHRLMCGDSTDKADVDKLMDGGKADVVFTDPPYGMKKENEGVLNDNLNYDDLLEFNKQWIKLSFGCLQKVGSWYCWGICEPLMDIYSCILKPMIKKNELTFRNWITWDKYSENPTMRVSGIPMKGFRMYYPSSEFCLFVMKGVQGFNTNSDNYYEGWEPIRKYLVQELEKTGLSAKELKPYIGEMYGHYFTKSQWTLPTEEKYNQLRKASQHDAFKKEYDELKKEYDELKKEYYATRSFFDSTHEHGLKDTWRYCIDDNKEMSGIHATPKPLELCSRAIKSSSRDNESVLDLFGGSGSTLIACEQLNRKCYMMELDPKYCSVIIERWEALTNKEAQKLGE